jgi:hypothetical protein
MRLGYRLALGLAVGCVLSLWSAVLAGAGEGAISPLVASAPMLVWVLALTKLGFWGFWLLVFATGLLWSIYFGTLPAIKSFVLRIVAVVLVGLVHLGAAGWMLTKDLGFDREYERYPNLTIGYFVFLWVAVIALGALTWTGPKQT